MLLERIHKDMGSFLALDAKRILDTLNVEKAHLVGFCMGGMVAQAFAIRFPKQTLALTFIMSSGNILDKQKWPIRPILSLSRKLLTSWEITHELNQPFNRSRQRSTIEDITYFGYWRQPQKGGELRCFVETDTQRCSRP
jgi:pimeloyl-ACP methyl ester carboxylesterase